ncbi:hypothetical protein ACRAWD_07610 [Caulobacter segnis]
MRASLLEIVFRLTDIADEERQRANQRQELLIAELNHRVRNILGLIRGLISQSRLGRLDRRGSSPRWSAAVSRPGPRPRPDHAPPVGTGRAQRPDHRRGRGLSVGQGPARAL